MALAAELKQIAADNERRIAAESEEVYQKVVTWLKANASVSAPSMDEDHTLYRQIKHHWNAIKTRLAAGGVKIQELNGGRDDFYLVFNWS